MDDYKNSKKLYFSIGEVVKITKISESLLRKWESEFRQLNPKRTERGQRQYKKEDIELILTIKSLRDDSHLDYEGIRQRLNSKLDDAQRNAQIISRLKKVRKTLVDIRHNLNAPQALNNEIIVTTNENIES